MELADTKSYSKRVSDQILLEYQSMVESISVNAFEQFQTTIRNATGKSIDLDKAAAMYKRILTERIKKSFVASWEEMELSKKLDELKAAKESTISEEKQFRPSDFKVEDQARHLVMQSLLKRRQILERQVNYQNRMLENDLVPAVEQARAICKSLVHQRQKVLSNIREDEANVDYIQNRIIQSR